MKIRFAIDIPYLSPKLIMEDTEEIPDEGHIPVWRVYIDQEFNDMWDPVMDLSWAPKGVGEAMEVRVEPGYGIEFTFVTEAQAEAFIEWVNDLLRHSIHGWRGGDPAREA